VYKVNSIRYSPHEGQPGVVECDQVQYETGADEQRPWGRGAVPPGRQALTRECFNLGQVARAGRPFMELQGPKQQV
jgi:hypothetical protein